MVPGTKDRRWKQIHLRIPVEEAERAAEVFLLAGCSGVEWIDAGHPAPPGDLPADWVELRGSLSLGDDVEGVLKILQGKLTAGRPWVVELDEQDWAESWKEHFKPVRIGRFFIHPGWIEPKEEDGLALRIDPGLAFGTGMHPTTRLCIQALDQALPADSLLDLGCGSGILALAAALAGVPRILAMDNDPEAVIVSQENASKNGLLGRLQIQGGELAQVQGRYDLVLANILSGTLIELAPEIVDRVQPEGKLILSGILGSEAEQVRAAYTALGLIHEATELEAEWCAVRLGKPAA
ncbi:MAG: 50S ribosomal protein L11 methyltransferase [Deltaproteobacteria bacterium]|nr:50S ribosomal protein L11 methyltransferase [Deltaproteobacteria bacterium]